MKILLFFSLFINLVYSSYNANIANISAKLSANTYCDKENYKKLEIPGFELKSIFSNKGSDMEGFIGTMQRNIYIVFRGSSSIRNWIKDLEFMKTKYPYCSGCEVHKGFYKTTLLLTEQILNGVKPLLSQNDNIIVSGHSYGAAVSTLMGLELINSNIGARVYNFGQPRIGNAEFSKYVTTALKEYWRFTHNRDIVPHVPIITLGYYHSCGEIFQYGEIYDIKKLLICSKTDCEDQTCSDQYTLSETNVDDHMTYLGINMECPIIF